MDNGGPMKRVIRSHFISAVLGGLVVGAGLIAVGPAGRGHTETIVEEAPVASEPATGVGGTGLTAHDIYQRDAPGVVYVSAKLVAPVPSPFDMFQARKSTTSTGSGFLVDGHGDVLTDYHVVDGAARTGGVTVEFEDDTIRKAGVVAVDPGSDLAVLRVDMRGVPPVVALKLGDSTTVRVGDPTLTIGNPFGIDRTLTSGIVSAFQHRIAASDGRIIDKRDPDRPADQRREFRWSAAGRRRVRHRHQLSDRDCGRRCPPGGSPSRSRFRSIRPIRFSIRWP